MALLVFEEVSAATAAGTVLSEKAGLAVVNYARVLSRIAVTGSSAAGNAAVDLYIGQTFIGTFANTSTGVAPVEAKDYKPVGWIANPSEPVIVKIKTASTSNILHVEIETSP